MSKGRDSSIRRDQQGEHVKAIARLVANQLGARQLLLVKHVCLAGTTIRLADLIARGIIDKAFADLLKNVPAAVLGPADQGSLATIIACGAAAGTRIDP